MSAIYRSSKMKSKKYDISITIPHYNEESNVMHTIPGMFDAFRKKDVLLEIVAVDNGSVDSTLSNLLELKKKYGGLKIISLKNNQGFGGGIIRGLVDCSADVIGFTCADDQINPEDMVRLYRAFDKDSFAVVKTIRTRRFDGMHRAIFSKIFNGLCRLIFRIRTKDINGYPVFMGQGLFSAMRLEKKDWMINMEILVKSRLLGAKLIEMPAVFYRRTKGKTAVKLSTLFQFLFQIFSYALAYFLSEEYRRFRKQRRKRMHDQEC